MLIITTGHRYISNNNSNINIGSRRRRRSLSHHLHRRRHHLLLTAFVTLIITAASWQQCAAVQSLSTSDLFDDQNHPLVQRLADANTMAIFNAKEDAMAANGTNGSASLQSAHWPSQTNKDIRLKSAEYRLYQHLFKGGRYRKTVRPKADHNERMIIQLGICIMSVDEILEQDPMVTSGCVKLKWMDEYLRWNPAEFGNLTSLVLPSSEIWLPDIALINSAEPYITNRTSFVEVSFKGSVGFYPSGRFATKCKISLTFFPFDRQVCEMSFESWTYPIEWIELVLWPAEPIDVKEFYRNHQWDLDRVDAVSGKAYYDGFEFSTMRFVFHVRRRTLHYVTLYVFPCALISVMQVLSHSLPVEHPARITLLTGIFVAQSVIQSSLTSQTPKSSDGISLTQLYIEIFTACMLFSMVVTFINMHVWFRVSTSPLLASCTFPSLSVLIKSFFFWDINSCHSSPIHLNSNFQHSQMLLSGDSTQAIFATEPDERTSMPRNPSFVQESNKPAPLQHSRHFRQQQRINDYYRRLTGQLESSSESLGSGKTRSSHVREKFRYVVAAATAASASPEFSPDEEEPVARRPSIKTPRIVIDSPDISSEKRFKPPVRAQSMPKPRQRYLEELKKLRKVEESRNKRELVHHLPGVLPRRATEDSFRHKSQFSGNDTTTTDDDIPASSSQKPRRRVRHAASCREATKNDALNLIQQQQRQRLRQLGISLSTKSLPSERAGCDENLSSSDNDDKKRRSPPPPPISPSVIRKTTKSLSQSQLQITPATSLQSPLYLTDKSFSYNKLVVPTVAPTNTLRAGFTPPPKTMQFQFSSSMAKSSVQRAVSMAMQKETWLRFCLTLDKICMYVFAISNVISPFFIFIVIPHTYNQYLRSFDEDAHNATNYFYTTENINVHYFHDFDR